MYRQVRIFAPQSTVPFDNEFWVETLIGSIIKPTVDQAAGLEWFWFSRYNCTPQQDSNDCDITKIGNDFQDPQTRHYRSVRFRYSISGPDANQFETGCQALIEKAGCRVSDFRDYGFEDDLGNDLHLDGDKSASRKTNRANIVARLYEAISVLVMDALTGPDTQGRFAMEINNHPRMSGSSFRQPLHLFCNMTAVPIELLVQGPNGPTKIRLSL